MRTEKGNNDYDFVNTYVSSVEVYQKEIWVSVRDPEVPEGGVSKFDPAVVFPTTGEVIHDLVEVFGVLSISEIKGKPCRLVYLGSERLLSKDHDRKWIGISHFMHSKWMPVFDYWVDPENHRLGPKGSQPEFSRPPNEPLKAMSSILFPGSDKQKIIYTITGAEGIQIAKEVDEHFARWLTDELGVAQIVEYGTKPVD